MYQIILPFLLGPLDFFNPYYSKSRRISELNRENFKLKVKQRIIIINLSCIAWYTYIKHDIEIMNQKKIKKLKVLTFQIGKVKWGMIKKPNHNYISL